MYFIIGGFSFGPRAKIRFGVGEFLSGREEPSVRRSTQVGASFRREAPVKYSWSAEGWTCLIQTRSACYIAYRSCTVYLDVGDFLCRPELPLWLPAAGNFSFCWRRVFITGREEPSFSACYIARRRQVFIPGRFALIQHLPLVRHVWILS